MSVAGRRQERRRRDGQGGFTLIELLVVVVILGILAAVVVFAVRGSGDKGRKAAVQTDERIIRTALEVFCAKNGRYPGGLNAPDQFRTHPMDELVDGKYLGNPSEYHTLYTGDADVIPEFGQRSSTPRVSAPAHPRTTSSSAQTPTAERPEAHSSRPRPPRGPSALSPEASNTP